MHHPIYSADEFHGGSDHLRGVLDDAVAASGRTPDAVNYQRFTRSQASRDVPYVVSGAGGYWHLHYMAKDQGQPLPTPWQDPVSGITLESYCEDRHGFLRLTVSGQSILGEYVAVPRGHESWRDGPVAVHDSFTLDLSKHKLVKPTPAPAGTRSPRRGRAAARSTSAASSRPSSEGASRRSRT